MTHRGKTKHSGRKTEQQMLHPASPHETLMITHAEKKLMFEVYQHLTHSE